MIAEKMKPFVQNNSAIRMMFEEGNRLRAKYGADKVYDFSLGKSKCSGTGLCTRSIIESCKQRRTDCLHGYMSNAGSRMSERRSHSL